LIEETGKTGILSCSSPRRPRSWPEWRRR
jgi:hypothetical protein